MSVELPVPISALNIYSPNVDDEVLEEGISNIPEEPFETPDNLTSLVLKLEPKDETPIEVSKIEVDSNADIVQLTYTTITGESVTITNTSPERNGEFEFDIPPTDVTDIELILTQVEEGPISIGELKIIACTELTTLSTSTTPGYCDDMSVELPVPISALNIYSPNVDDEVLEEGISNIPEEPFETPDNLTSLVLKLEPKDETPIEVSKIVVDSNADIVQLTYTTITGESVTITNTSPERNGEFEFDIPPTDVIDIELILTQVEEGPISIGELKIIACTELTSLSTSTTPGYCDDMSVELPVPISALNIYSPNVDDEVLEEGISNIPEEPFETPDNLTSLVLKLEPKDETPIEVSKIVVDSNADIVQLTYTTITGESVTITNTSPEGNGEFEFDIPPTDVTDIELILTQVEEGPISIGELKIIACTELTTLLTSTTPGYCDDMSVELPVPISALNIYSPNVDDEVLEEGISNIPEEPFETPDNLTSLVLKLEPKDETPIEVSKIVVDSNADIVQLTYTTITGESVTITNTSPEGNGEFEFDIPPTDVTDIELILTQVEEGPISIGELKIIACTELTTLSTSTTPGYCDDMSVELPVPISALNIYSPNVDDEVLEEGISNIPEEPFETPDNLTSLVLKLEPKDETPIEVSKIVVDSNADIVQLTYTTITGESVTITNTSPEGNGEFEFDIPPTDVTDIELILTQVEEGPISIGELKIIACTELTTLSTSTTPGYCDDMSVELPVPISALNIYSPNVDDEVLEEGISNIPEEPFETPDNLTSLVLKLEPKDETPIEVSKIVVDSNADIVQLTYTTITGESVTITNTSPEGNGEFEFDIPPTDVTDIELILTQVEEGPISIGELKIIACTELTTLSTSTTPGYCDDMSVELPVPISALNIYSPNVDDEVLEEGISNIPEEPFETPDNLTSLVLKLEPKDETPIEVSKIVVDSNADIVQLTYTTITGESVTITNTSPEGNGEFEFDIPPTDVTDIELVLTQVEEGPISIGELKIIACTELTTLSTSTTPGYCDDMSVELPVPISALNIYSPNVDDEVLEEGISNIPEEPFETPDNLTSLVLKLEPKDETPIEVSKIVVDSNADIVQLTYTTITGESVTITNTSPEGNGEFEFDIPPTDVTDIELVLTQVEEGPISIGELKIIACTELTTLSTSTTPGYCDDMSVELPVPISALNIYSPNVDDEVLEEGISNIPEEPFETPDNLTSLVLKLEPKDETPIEVSKIVVDSNADIVQLTYTTITGESVTITNTSPERNGEFEFDIPPTDVTDIELVLTQVEEGPISIGELKIIACTELTTLSTSTTPGYCDDMSVELPVPISALNIYSPNVDDEVLEEGISNIPEEPFETPDYLTSLVLKLEPKDETPIEVSKIVVDSNADIVQLTYTTITGESVTITNTSPEGNGEFEFDIPPTDVTDIELILTQVEEGPISIGELKIIACTELTTLSTSTTPGYCDDMSVELPVPISALNIYSPNVDDEVLEEGISNIPEEPFETPDNLTSLVLKLEPKDETPIEVSKIVVDSNADIVQLTYTTITGESVTITNTSPEGNGEFEFDIPPTDVTDIELVLTQVEEGPISIGELKIIACTELTTLSTSTTPGYCDDMSVELPVPISALNIYSPNVDDEVLEEGISNIPEEPFETPDNLTSLVLKLEPKDETPIEVSKIVVDSNADIVQLTYTTITGESVTITNTSPEGNGEFEFDIPPTDVTDIELVLTQVEEGPISIGELKIIACTELTTLSTSTTPGYCDDMSVELPVPISALNIYSPNVDDEVLEEGISNIPEEPFETPDNLTSLVLKLEPKDETPIEVSKIVVDSNADIVQLTYTTITGESVTITNTSPEGNGEFEFDIPPTDVTDIELILTQVEEGPISIGELKIIACTELTTLSTSTTPGYCDDMSVELPVPISALNIYSPNVDDEVLEEGISNIPEEPFETPDNLTSLVLKLEPKDETPIEVSKIVVDSNADIVQLTYTTITGESVTITNTSPERNGEFEFHIPPTDVTDIELVLTQVEEGPISIGELKIIACTELTTLSTSTTPGYCDDMSVELPVPISALNIYSPNVDDEVLEEGISNIPEEPFETPDNLTSLVLKLEPKDETPIEVSKIVVDSNADIVQLTYTTINGESVTITNTSPERNGDFEFDIPPTDVTDIELVLTQVEEGPISIGELKIIACTELTTLSTSTTPGYCDDMSVELPVPISALNIYSPNVDDEVLEEGISNIPEEPFETPDNLTSLVLKLEPKDETPIEVSKIVVDSNADIVQLTYTTITGESVTITNTSPERNGEFEFDIPPTDVTDIELTLTQVEEGPISIGELKIIACTELTTLSTSTTPGFCDEMTVPQLVDLNTVVVASPDLSNEEMGAIQSIPKEPFSSNENLSNLEFRLLPEDGSPIEVSKIVVETNADEVTVKYITTTGKEIPITVFAPDDNGLFVVNTSPEYVTEIVVTLTQDEERPIDIEVLEILACVEMSTRKTVTTQGFCDEMTVPQLVDLNTIIVASPDLSEEEMGAIQSIPEEPFTSHENLTNLEFRILPGDGYPIEVSQIVVGTNADEVTVKYLTTTGEEIPITSFIVQEISGFVDTEKTFIIRAKNSFEGGNITIDLYKSNTIDPIEITSVLVEACVPLPTVSTTVSGFCDDMSVEQPVSMDAFTFSSPNVDDEVVEEGIVNISEEPFETPDNLTSLVLKLEPKDETAIEVSKIYIGTNVDEVTVAYKTSDDNEISTTVTSRNENGLFVVDTPPVDVTEIVVILTQTEETPIVIDTLKMLACVELTTTEVTTTPESICAELGFEKVSLTEHTVPSVYINAISTSQFPIIDNSNVGVLWTSDDEGSVISLIVTPAIPVIIERVVLQTEVTSSATSSFTTTTTSEEECTHFTVDTDMADNYVNIELTMGDQDLGNLNYLLQPNEPFTSYVDDAEIVFTFNENVQSVDSIQLNVVNIQRLSYTIMPGDETFVKNNIMRFGDLISLEFGFMVDSVSIVLLSYVGVPEVEGVVIEICGNELATTVSVPPIVTTGLCDSPFDHICDDGSCVENGFINDGYCDCNDCSDETGTSSVSSSSSSISSSFTSTSSQGTQISTGSGAPGSGSSALSSSSTSVPTTSSWSFSQGTTTPGTSSVSSSSSSISSSFTSTSSQGTQTSTGSGAPGSGSSASSSSSTSVPTTSSWSFSQGTTTPEYCTDMINQKRVDLNELTVSADDNDQNGEVNRMFREITRDSVFVSNDNLSEFSFTLSTVGDESIELSQVIINSDADEVEIEYTTADNTGDRVTVPEGNETDQFLVDLPIVDGVVLIQITFKTDTSRKITITDIIINQCIMVTTTGSVSTSGTSSVSSSSSSISPSFTSTSSQGTQTSTGTGSAGSGSSLSSTSSSSTSTSSQETGTSSGTSSVSSSSSSISSSFTSTSSQGTQTSTGSGAPGSGSSASSSSSTSVPTTSSWSFSQGTTTPEYCTDMINQKRVDLNELTVSADDNDQNGEVNRMFREITRDSVFVSNDNLSEFSFTLSTVGDESIELSQVIINSDADEVEIEYTTADNTGDRVTVPEGNETDQFLVDLPIVDGVVLIQITFKTDTSRKITITDIIINQCIMVTTTGSVSTSGTSSVSSSSSSISPSFTSTSSQGTQTSTGTGSAGSGSSLSSTSSSSTSTSSQETGTSSGTSSVSSSSSSISSSFTSTSSQGTQTSTGSGAPGSGSSASSSSSTSVPTTSSWSFSQGTTTPEYCTDMINQKRVDLNELTVSADDNDQNGEVNRMFREITRDSVFVSNDNLSEFSFTLSTVGDESIELSQVIINSDADEVEIEYTTADNTGDRVTVPEGNETDQFLVDLPIVDGVVLIQITFKTDTSRKITITDIIINQCIMVTTTGSVSTSGTSSVSSSSSSISPSFTSTSSQGTQTSTGTGSAGSGSSLSSTSSSSTSTSSQETGTSSGTSSVSSSSSSISSSFTSTSSQGTQTSTGSGAPGSGSSASSSSSTSVPTTSSWSFSQGTTTPEYCTDMINQKRVDLNELTVSADDNDQNGEVNRMFREITRDSVFVSNDNLSEFSFTLSTVGDESIELSQVIINSDADEVEIEYTTADNTGDRVTVPEGNETDQFLVDLPIVDGVVLIQITFKTDTSRKITITDIIINQCIMVTTTGSVSTSGTSSVSSSSSSISPSFTSTSSQGTQTSTGTGSAGSGSSLSSTSSSSTSTSSQETGTSSGTSSVSSSSSSISSSFTSTSSQGTQTSTGSGAPGSGSSASSSSSTSVPTTSSWSFSQGTTTPEYCTDMINQKRVDLNELTVSADDNDQNGEVNRMFREITRDSVFVSNDNLSEFSFTLSTVGDESIELSQVIINSDADEVEIEYTTADNTGDRVTVPEGNETDQFLVDLPIVDGVVLIQITFKTDTSRKITITDIIINQCIMVTTTGSVSTSGTSSVSSSSSSISPSFTSTSSQGTQTSTGTGSAGSGSSLSSTSSSSTSTSSQETGTSSGTSSVSSSSSSISSSFTSTSSQGTQTSTGSGAPGSGSSASSSSSTSVPTTSSWSFSQGTTTPEYCTDMINQKRVDLNELTVSADDNDQNGEVNRMFREITRDSVFVSNDNLSEFSFTLSTVGDESIELSQVIINSDADEVEIEYTTADNTGDRVTVPEGNETDQFLVDLPIVDGVVLIQITFKTDTSRKITITDIIINQCIMVTTTGSVSTSGTSSVSSSSSSISPSFTSTSSQGTQTSTGTGSAGSGSSLSSTSSSSTSTSSQETGTSSGTSSVSSSSSSISSSFTSTSSQGTQTSTGSGAPGSGSSASSSSSTSVPTTSSWSFSQGTTTPEYCTDMINQKRVDLNELTVSADDNDQNGEVNRMFREITRDSVFVSNDNLSEFSFTLSTVGDESIELSQVIINSDADEVEIEYTTADNTGDRVTVPEGNETDQFLVDLPIVDGVVLIQITFKTDTSRKITITDIIINQCIMVTTTGSVSTSGTSSVSSSSSSISPSFTSTSSQGTQTSTGTGSAGSGSSLSSTSSSSTSTSSQETGTSSGTSSVSSSSSSISSSFTSTSSQGTQTSTGSGAPGSGSSASSSSSTSVPTTSSWSFSQGTTTPEYCTDMINQKRVDLNELTVSADDNDQNGEVNRMFREITRDSVFVSNDNLSEFSFTLSTVGDESIELSQVIINSDADEVEIEYTTADNTGDRVTVPEGNETDQFLVDLPIVDGVVLIQITFKTDTSRKITITDIIINQCIMVTTTGSVSTSGTSSVSSSSSSISPSFTSTSSQGTQTSTGTGSAGSGSSLSSTSSSSTSTSSQETGTSSGTSSVSSSSSSISSSFTSTSSQGTQTSTGSGAPGSGSSASSSSSTSVPTTSSWSFSQGTTTPEYCTDMINQKRVDLNELTVSADDNDQNGEVNRMFREITRDSVFVSNDNLSEFSFTLSTVGDESIELSQVIINSDADEVEIEYTTADNTGDRVTVPEGNETDQFLVDLPIVDGVVLIQITFKTDTSRKITITDIIINQCIMVTTTGSVSTSGTSSVSSSSSSISPSFTSTSSQGTQTSTGSGAPGSGSSALSSSSTSVPTTSSWSFSQGTTTPEYCTDMINQKRVDLNELTVSADDNDQNGEVNRMFREITRDSVFVSNDNLSEFSFTLSTVGDESIELSQVIINSDADEVEIEYTTADNTGDRVTVPEGNETDQFLVDLPIVDGVVLIQITFKTDTSRKITITDIIINQCIMVTTTGSVSTSGTSSVSSSSSSISSSFTSTSSQGTQTSTGPYCRFSVEDFRRIFDNDPLTPVIGYVDLNRNGYDANDEQVEIDQLIPEGVVVSALCKYCECIDLEIECQEQENCTDCEYTEWTTWSSCTSTCGGGVTSRSRTIVSPGLMCDYHTQESEECNTDSCEIPSWNTWSPWSECSSTESCVLGESTRTRTCSILDQCGDDNMESAPCNIDDDCTPEDCTEPNMVLGCGNLLCSDNYMTCFDEFFDMYCEEIEENCIESCVCKPGFKLNDDNVCVETCSSCYTEVGEQIFEGMTDPSIDIPCQYCECERQMDGTYKMVCQNDTNCCESDEWSEWGECVTTCGQGTRYRRRNVYGIDCDLPEEESDYCEEEACPLDCFHGDSGYALGEYVPGYEDCSICTCMYPDTVTSGIRCVTNTSAKVDGQWGSWSSWSDCTSRSGCGEGAMQRVRSCDRPFPSCGGDECQGDTIETQTCQLPSCCETTEWSDFGNCSKSCNTGEQNRTRQLIDSTDHCNDVILEETRPCNTDPCDEECYISEWSEFDPCSVTCGNGIQSRFRDIIVGDCEGYHLTELKDCYSGPCPEECAENQVPDNRTVCETETCFDYIAMVNNVTLPECSDTGMAMYDCYCDEGFYLDANGNCVTPQECTMCRLENGMLIQENEVFQDPETCTEYTCYLGQLLQQSVCEEEYVCDAGESLVMLEGKCCPECRPVEELPDKCQLHTRSERLRNGNCVSIDEVEVSFCAGTCGSSLMKPLLFIDSDDLQVESSCTCCQGEPGDIVNVDVMCAGQRRTAHFVNMRSCSCDVCADSLSNGPPPGFGLPTK
ncbi:hypothetical protein ACF0H5_014391 [Mactra antiquata]